MNKGEYEQLESKRKVLFRNVIMQAFDDLVNGNSKQRAEVDEWIGSDDFSTVCELAAANEIEVTYNMRHCPERVLTLFKALQARKYSTVLE